MKMISMKGVSLFALYPSTGNGNGVELSKNTSYIMMYLSKLLVSDLLVSLDCDSFFLDSHGH